MPQLDHIDEICDGCTIGKQHRLAFPQATKHRSEHALDLVHTDLCGPIKPATAAGNQYFLLVVDDCSRYMWLELLKTKDEAFSKFRKVQALAEAKQHCRLRAFRSDRGGEFNSNEIIQWCSKEGIQHFTTAPYSPQQNGVVERRNQTVVEMARCMLKSMAMPAMFWGEAVKCAVYILNRAPTRSLNGVTPYEAWNRRKPTVEHLRTFGCVAHMKKTGPGLTKLSDRSLLTVFVGYEEGSKAYRVYDPVGARLYVTRDVVFEERRPWSWEPEQNSSTPSTFSVVYVTEAGASLTDDGSESSGNTSPGSLPPPSRGTPSTTPATTPLSTPATSPSPTPLPTVQWCTPPSRDSALDAADEGNEVHRYRRVANIYDTTAPDVEPDESDEPDDEIVDTQVLGLVAAEEPASVEEALQTPEWRRAMEEEMSCIADNKTWTRTVLPAGHRAIGLKWVFKLKKDHDGNVVKYKARLVVKGYAQRQGVDFDEVYAPVARMETVRILLALAAHGGWEVHHMDVKSAFLNGELAEEVYVQQPPGFVVEEDRHAVLKLSKALYGLRQAPRAWYAKLDSSLVDLGFTRSPVEHAVYRRGNDKEYLLVGVYVDDLIITGTCVEEIMSFKAEMHRLFKMSDLGLLSYYLGIEVRQEHGEITVCQRAYAEKILERAGMAGCNACHTPMEARLKLKKEDGAQKVDATEFRSVIGCLRYLVNTRPDIALAVGVASRFMESPSTIHWAVVKQILRYVSGTLNHGCRYMKGVGSPELVGYTDSDHAGDVNDRKSTSGVVFFLGGSTISWTSQKQKVVAMSSCEAEYIAAGAGACQGVWLSNLIADLTGKSREKFKLYVDNKSAIALCKNPVHHDRTKHIDIKFHKIRQCIEEGKLDVYHVRTDAQLADALTKALGRTRFIEMRVKLGVVSVQV
jgi:hypothetical protein